MGTDTFIATKDTFFTASHDAQFAPLGVVDNLKRVVLRGVCIDTTVNRNNWAVLEEDLEEIALKSIDTQVRIDHSNSIKDVKGRILSAEVDQPHLEAKEDWDLPNPNPHVHYTAEILSNDSNILIPIVHGYVDHVSIGLDSKVVYCSECGESTRPTRTCDCVNAHDIVRNPRINEYSIVCSPAYDSTKFKTYSASEKKKSECEKEEEIEIDKNQELSEVESDEEVACSEEKASEETTEVASEVQDIEEKGEDVDTMAEDFTELKAMFEELAGVTKQLIASNNSLIERIEALEADTDNTDEASCDGKKAGTEPVGGGGAGGDGGDKEASEEEEEEEEPKEKKASKKKASNGMKEVPGGAGDPPGEEKKEIKKSPIEAGVIVKSTFKANVEKDTMGKAIDEVFKFAAGLNIYPLEG